MPFLCQFLYYLLSAVALQYNPSVIIKMDQHKSDNPSSLTKRFFLPKFCFKKEKQDEEHGCVCKTKNSAAFVFQFKVLGV